MTTTQIEKQIQVINKATKDAAKSKETALKFLTDAGIIKQEKKNVKSKK